MRIGVFAAGAAAAVLAFSAASAEPLKHEHYLEWENAGGAQISPDGSTIIYTRSRVDKIEDKFSSELWIMDADGARHRHLTSGGNVQWSPSGDRIAYIGEGGQIFVRWMDAEGATSQVTHDIKGPSQIKWSPDGEWIAFRAKVPIKSDWTINLPARPSGAKWTEDARVFGDLHYRIDRQGYIEGRDHLFIVPADGGSALQITEGDWDVGARFSGIDFSSGFDWTPDGAALVFSGVPSDEELLAFDSDINSVDIMSKEITTLKDSNAIWRSPRVSPNGRQIAFIGGVAEGVNSPAAEIRVMNRDGSGDRMIIEDLASSPGFIEWAENGRGLYFGMAHQGRADLFYVDLNGNLRQVTEGTHQFNPSSMASNGVFAGTLSAPTQPGAIAAASGRNGALRRLTDLNADILMDVELSDYEEIWYESYDGLRIQGWILKPPGFDPSQEYPIHLIIHGGPEGMYGVNFSYYFQWWAAQGYVVLITNPRGSSGYGAEFMHQIDNRYPGEGDYEDLMAGVDEVIRRGYIDEDRQYVSGCSGGGALTSWIVTRTDRFAAAAALCPVTNWISFGGSADVSMWGYTRFRPPFWEDPTLWLEHSPIMHVGNVVTPTLLMTGDLDLRTPIEQAEEFYTALKMRGVPTKLIAMRNEYHGTVSIPSNMFRTQLFLDKWFTEHGGGAGGNEE